MPEQLGHYRLEAKLGSGGMGLVYAATDQRDGREVAIKMIMIDDVEPDAVQRFRRETETTMALDHPHIVRVFDHGEEQGCLYYVMEHIRGTTLQDWLSLPKVSIDARLRVVQEVAEAIDCAHEHGVIHRDIKPSNVVVDDTGHAWVMDFGLVRLIESSQALTRSSDAIGTPLYMSPEQACGEHRECGPATDIWSLGVVLYQAVTGSLPFNGINSLAIMATIVKHEPVSPRRLRPELSADVDSVVMQCLEKRPSQRYLHARDLAADIAALRANRRVQARRYGTAQRLWRRTRRHAIRIVMLMAIVALFGLLVGLFWWQRYQQWGRWNLLFDHNFVVDGIPADGSVEFRDAQMVHTVTPWKCDEDGLWMEHLQWIWLPELYEPGDVKLVLEMRSVQMLDGLELVINSRLQSLGTEGDMPIGYSCLFGGYAGSVDYVSQNRVPDRSRRHKYTATPSPLEVDRIHQLVFERVGDQLSIYVDGKKVNSQRFPLPLSVGELTDIGVRAYGSNWCMRSMQVYRLAPGAQIDSMRLGDTLVRSGQWEEAVNEYQLLADAYPRSDLAERALTRAYLAMLAADIGTPSARGQLRDRLKREHPGSAGLAAIYAADAEMAWIDGDVDRAIDLCQLAWEIDSRDRGLLRCIANKQLHLTEAESVRVLGFLPRIDDCQALEVDGLNLSSLEPLRDMPLIWLSARFNHIADLSPLAGMPLRYLMIADNQVRDLTPLEGMPLLDLSAQNNVIENADVLGSNPHFMRITLSQNRLKRLPKFAGTNMVKLQLKGNQISDVRPLSGLVNLQILNLGDNQIADLDPLRSLTRVESLTISNNRVADLSPLAGMRSLCYLSAFDNVITDISPLAAMPLQTLDLSGNPIEQIEALNDMPLVELMLSGCPIRQVSPLIGKVASLVDIRGSLATDLERFAGRVPRRFHFSVSHLDSSQLASLLDAFAAAGDSHCVRQLQALIAIRQADTGALANILTPESPVLEVPVWVNLAEARALAESVGLTLSMPNDRSDIGHFWRFRVPAHSWTGLQIKDGLYTQPNGVPLDDQIQVRPYVKLESGDHHGVMWTSRSLAPADPDLPGTPVLLYREP